MRVAVLIVVLVCIGCSHADQPNTSDVDKQNIISKLNRAAILKNSQTDSSLLLAQEALNLSQKSGYEDGVALSSMIIGEICYERGEYNKASSYLVESLRIFEVSSNSNELAKTYNLMGRTYQNNDQFELARSNYSEALKAYTKVDNQSGIAETYGNIGHLNEKIGDYDSAIHYNFLAKRLYEQSSDSIGIATIYDNIGSIKEDLGDYEEARTNFQKAYDINIELGDEVGALINANNIADTYRKTRQFEKALGIIHQVLREAKNLNQPYQVKSAYRDISLTYFPMGNYKTAFLYLDSCYQIADQLASQEIARGIEETRSFYELERKQQQIEILEKNKRLSQILRTGLIILTILLVVIGVLIFTQLKTRIKKDHLLFEAEKKLTQAKQAQLESALDLKKLREEKLFQELESRSKELTANALHIIRKNEFLTKLQNELRSMKSSKDETLNKKLKKAIKSINLNFSLDDDWHEFEAIFEKVHNRFFEELKCAHPSLTSAEIRLCAMMKLNLPSKDIATIMGISQDSLRISRYRLRKKLGVDKGANLYSFIMGIS